MKHLLNFSLLFCLIQCATVDIPTGCNEIRAAFDIGSGTSRINVAEVDICLNKVIRNIYEDSASVSYKDDLIASKNNQLSSSIKDLGIATLKKFKKNASVFHPVAFQGTATSAFRMADNGKAFIKSISEETGITIRVIDQKEEALLGFFGGLASTKSDGTNTLVWDIGASSMQITGRNSEGFDIYEGHMAASSFKRQIIEKIQKRKFETTRSPNPISTRQSEAALKLVKAEAKKINAALRKKLANKKTKVIGIGGVHYYSIRLQTGESTTITRQKIKEALVKQLGKSDQEIGGKYASSQVSNLALVLGFMEELKIDQIEVSKVNLSDGILLSDKYWQTSTANLN